MSEIHSQGASQPRWPGLEKVTKVIMCPAIRLGAITIPHDMKSNLILTSLHA